MNVSGPLPARADRLPPGEAQRQALALLEHDVRVCTRMLDEAQRLARTGQNGPVLLQFVRRARQILEEMQELPLAIATRQDAVLSERIARLRETAETLCPSLRMGKEERSVGSSADC